MSTIDTLFRVVFQSRHIQKLIFKEVKVVNRIKNNCLIDCQCLLNEYSVDVPSLNIIGSFPKFTKHFECCKDNLTIPDYGFVDLRIPGKKRNNLDPYHLCYPRYSMFNRMTFEWCCGFGTPSLFIDLFNQLTTRMGTIMMENSNDSSNNNNNFNNSNSSKYIQEYLKSKIFDKCKIISLITGSINCGNVDMFKFLLQFSLYLYGKEDQYGNVIVDEIKAIQYDDKLPSQYYYDNYNREELKKYIQTAVHVSMKFGYIYLLQFVLEMDRIAIDNSEDLEIDYLTSLMTTYSGCRLECLEKSDQHKKWKTKKEFKTKSINNIDFKIIKKSFLDIRDKLISFEDSNGSFPPTSPSTRPIIKKQKINHNQENNNVCNNNINNNCNNITINPTIIEETDITFPISSSTYYISMFQLVNHIKYLKKSDVNAYYYVDFPENGYADYFDYFSQYQYDPQSLIREVSVLSIDQLAAIHQDFQGIRYLFELGIRFRIAMDLESLDFLTTNQPQPLKIDIIYSLGNVEMMKYIWSHGLEDGLTEHKIYIDFNSRPAFQHAMIGHYRNNRIEFIKSQFNVKGLEPILYSYITHANNTDNSHPLGDFERRTLVYCIKYESIDTIRKYIKPDSFTTMDVATAVLERKSKDLLEVMYGNRPHEVIPNINTLVVKHSIPKDMLKWLVDRKMVKLPVKDHDEDICLIKELLEINQSNQYQFTRYIQYHASIQELEQMYQAIDNSKRTILFQDDFTLYLILNLIFNGFADKIKYKPYYEPFEKTPSLGDDETKMKRMLVFWAIDNNRLDILMYMHQSNIGIKWDTVVLKSSAIFIDCLERVFDVGDAYNPEIFYFMYNTMTPLLPHFFKDQDWTRLLNDFPRGYQFQDVYSPPPNPISHKILKRIYFDAMRYSKGVVWQIPKDDKLNYLTRTIETHLYQFIIKNNLN